MNREQIVSDIFRYLDVRRLQRSWSYTGSCLFCCHFQKHQKEVKREKFSKKNNNKQTTVPARLSCACIPGLQSSIFLLLRPLFLFLLLLSILISHRHFTAQCNIVAPQQQLGRAEPGRGGCAASHPRVKAAAPAIPTRNEGII